MLKENVNLIQEVLRQEDLQNKILLFNLLHKELLTTYTHEELLKLSPKDNADTLILTYLSLSCLYKSKNYIEAISLVQSSMYDFFIDCNKDFEPLICDIITKFYKCLKFALNNDPNYDFETSIFFKALIFNKENKNLQLTSLLTTICLDLLVLNAEYALCKPYLQIQITEKKYLPYMNYYKSFCFLVDGNYQSAINNAQTAILLSNSDYLKRKAEIVLVLSLLSLSEFMFLSSKKWHKNESHYQKLFVAVNSGCETLFKKVLSANKQLFIEDGTYFLVRRLFENVLLETIRKIGCVYSTITLLSISQRLNIDIDAVKLLLAKAIQRKVIFGSIENDVFVSIDVKEEDVDYKKKIYQAMDMYDTINQLMRTYRPDPVKFENLDKTSLAYEFD